VTGDDFLIFAQFNLSEAGYVKIRIDQIVLIETDGMIYYDGKYHQTSCIVLGTGQKRVVRGTPGQIGDEIQRAVRKAFDPKREY
jgi:hypothetical protein